MKKTIFDMYRTICVGENAVCKECNKEGLLDLPLSIYFVGKDFHSSDDSILFVGKTAIGGEGMGPLVNELFYDVTNFGERSLDGIGYKSYFYSYAHKIIESYYGSYNVGKESVALSNLIKCNNDSTKDETTYEMKSHCINELQVIWKEVEILKPKRIIFFSGNKYDDFIDEFTPVDYQSHIDVVADDKRGCWWHRRFFNEKNQGICDMLRVYHPDYMRYLGGNAGEEYISNIVEWLYETKIKND